MTEHYFLSVPEQIGNVAQKIFSTLGVTIKYSGEKPKVYSSSMFGVEIILEHNNYSHKEEYNYHLTVKKDTDSRLEANDFVIKKISDVVSNLFRYNLSLGVKI
ncbi:hypothetical protein [Ferruginibacter albus]|uniref:hypothetical protein n=1 Tax=Ferruginibacter albus TaxID=2875540 RepID=UPI001CC58F2F|nr:hypothetical protein [Ferruginibacter albus]UAY53248.1 hypothetical protein K9M53_06145 [Ferruginibacter albus]